MHRLLTTAVYLLTTAYFVTKTAGVPLPEVWTEVISY